MNFRLNKSHLGISAEFVSICMVKWFWIRICWNFDQKSSLKLSLQVSWKLTKSTYMWLDNNMDIIISIIALLNFGGGGKWLTSLNWNARSWSVNLVAFLEDHWEPWSFTVKALYKHWYRRTYSFCRDDMRLKSPSSKTVITFRLRSLKWKKLHVNQIW